MFRFVYRCLLRLYPGNFRREYYDEFLYIADDLDKDASALAKIEALGDLAKVLSWELINAACLDVPALEVVGVRGGALLVACAVNYGMWMYIGSELLPAGGPKNLPAIEAFHSSEEK